MNPYIYTRATKEKHIHKLKVVSSEYDLPTYA